MDSLLNLKNNTCAKIVSIDDSLPQNVIKRLKELGFVRGNKVKMLYKNNFAKSGIVAIYSGPISIDYKILQSITVE